MGELPCRSCLRDLTSTSSVACEPTRENRDRILAAAAQAFADDGLSVSLIEIARRAGVGNATLHRNFTKEQLVDELFQDWYARRQALAHRALADPDPWHGLVSFLEDVLADGSRNRAVGALFAVRAGWRERLRELMAQLLERAQAAGTARPDVTAEDLMLLMLGVSRTARSPSERARAVAPTAGRLPRRHPGRPRPRLPGLPISAELLDEDLCAWSQQMLRNALK